MQPHPILLKLHLRRTNLDYLGSVIAFKCEPTDKQFRQLTIDKPIFDSRVSGFPYTCILQCTNKPYAINELLTRIPNTESSIVYWAMHECLAVTEAFSSGPCTEGGGVRTTCWSGCERQNFVCLTKPVMGKTLHWLTNVSWCARSSKEGSSCYQLSMPINFHERIWWCLVVALAWAAP